MLKRQEIEKVVEAFKNNGNGDFSTKELIMYAIHRLDNLPCPIMADKITKVETKIRMLMWGVGILVGSFALLKFIFNFTI